MPPSGGLNPQNNITMKVNVCVCNNCMTLFVDQNPQTGALEYEVPESLPSLYFKEELVTTVYSDKSEITEPEGYWVCPVCDTDEFLMDI